MSHYHDEMMMDMLNFNNSIFVNQTLSNGGHICCLELLPTSFAPSRAGLKNIQSFQEMFH